MGSEVVLGMPQDAPGTLPSRDLETPGEGGEERTRWALLLVAVVVALGAALVAPRSWTEGLGRLEVSWQGEVVDDEAVTIGSSESVVLEGTAADVRLRAEFSGGVPTDKALKAWIGVERDGTPIRPALDDVRIALTLPDGEVELVPVLRWDRKKLRLEAERRPPVDTAVVLGLLGLVVILWVTEAIPLFVTSLLVPIVLVAARVGTAKAALGQFFNPIIALFFGGFLLAESMHRVGLDRRIATTIVAKAGRSPATLFGAMLAVSAFLSMWMSNTAATAVLVPIAIAVTAPLHHLGYRKAMVLGIAYAATIGGVGSLVGTPANPLAAEFLGTFVGREITFVGWFAFGLPLVVLFLPVMGAYLWWRSSVNVAPDAFAEARRLAREEHARSGPVTKDQKIVLAVFAGTMALWLTQQWHEIHPGIVALITVVALALLGKVRTADLGRISWTALLTFGGGLTLGVFLVTSGTSDWVATRMAGLAGLPHLLALGAVAFLALGLTAVASNTATAAMLVPLSIPLAGVLGMDPVLLVVVVAIASSIDFALVIGTPPTMIAYSTRLFTTRQIFRTGIVLDLIGIVILVTVVVWFWGLIGLL
jgi:sodium-dependent dicarboxylate transporter 2/3/5